MNGQCQACLIDNTPLVKHHWYEDDTHTTGYIKRICQKCNTILKTSVNSNNHVLPNWTTQLTIIHNYVPKTPKRANYNENTLVIPIRMPIALKNRIDYLVKRGKTNRNNWIKRTICLGKHVLNHL